MAAAKSAGGAQPADFGQDLMAAEIDHKGISLYELSPTGPDQLRIASALIMSRRKPEIFVGVVLPEVKLVKLGIKIVQTDGQTTDLGVVKNHHELRDVSYRKLEQYISLLLECADQTITVTVEQAVEFLGSHIANKKIDRKDILRPISNFEYKDFMRNLWLDDHLNFAPSTQTK